MKKSALTALLITLILMVLAIPGRGDDAVWLARSCVGESGWDAWNTGECAAILHIYKKRSRITGETTAQLAKRYSAAIKPHAGKRNHWVLWLTRDATRPDKWPGALRWSRFKTHWLMTLITVELFLLDMVMDPTPLAMHYGCKLDSQPPGARLMKTKFRNRFYR